MNLMCPSFVPEPPDFQLNNNQRRVTVIKKQPVHREEGREAVRAGSDPHPPTSIDPTPPPLPAPIPRVKSHTPRGAEMDGQLGAPEDEGRPRGGGE